MWGDAAEKSAPGGRGAAGALAEGPGRTGTGCRARDGRIARRPSHLGHPAHKANSPVPTPLKATVPSACGRGVSLKSRRPSQDPPPAALPPPRFPRAPRPHLGAGAGPAHRPEQQQRQAERPGGAGHVGRSGLNHRCHLRNRARRLIPGGRAAGGGRGGGAGAGPPRPREGPGGVPGLPPRPAEPLAVPAALLSPSRPGAAGPCAPQPRTPVKESQTTPHLFRAPQRKLRPEERMGLAQGHTVPQTLPGKCHPKNCE